MRTINKVLIVTPYVYAGGPVVLCELCRLLSKSGYDARLLPMKRLPSKSDYKDITIREYIECRIASLLSSLLICIVPNRRLRENVVPYDYYHPRHFKGCRIKFLPFFNGEKTLVVYPDMVYGNPFNGSNVVRWLLYHYGYVNDHEAYSESDMFLGYRDVFNDSDVKVFGSNVTINHFDSDLYKRTNFGNREGNCYIIRKGKDRPDLPDHFDGLVIDDFSEEEKVSVLNSCKRCYCYDTQTFYSSIAAVCGCESIIVPEPGKGRRDYRGDDERPLFGVAFGESQEEINWAKSTIPDLLQAIDPTQNNAENVQQFINNVEEFFGVCLKKA